MTVQLELWHLITLLIAFFGCVGAFGKVLLTQIDKRLEAQENARTEAQQRWEKEMQDLEGRIERMAERLPNEYVRREDWIRFSATIDAKMDTLHHKIDGLMEKLYARG